MSKSDFSVLFQWIKKNSLLLCMRRFWFHFHFLLHTDYQVIWKIVHLSSFSSLLVQEYRANHYWRFAQKTIIPPYFLLIENNFHSSFSQVKLQAVLWFLLVNVLNWRKSCYFNLNFLMMNISFTYVDTQFNIFVTFWESMLVRWKIRGNCKLHCKI